MTTTPETTPTTLHDRVALVTGAGTGIGAATAHALARRGARVALLGRRADRIEAVAAETGGLAVTADITDPVSLATALDRIRAEVGEPDLVVANAGAMLAAPFSDGARDEWSRMLEVNVLGLLDTARLTTDGLLAAAAAGRPADLVLVSSIAAHLVMPTYAVYTASKAAVSHLARTLRAELGPRGVRVRAVEPGLTESELGHDMGSAQSRADLEQFRAQVPAIPAEAIAEAIAWSSGLPAAVNAASLEVLPTVQG